MNSPVTPPATAPARGRPRSITRERIASAGIALGMADLTFVGVAAALGVSHMALYKHVPSLEELKYLVAEEIFSRWEIPRAAGADGQGVPPLETYLLVFSASVRELVKGHRGLTPYVLRRFAATPSMIAKIGAHQRHIAQAYGITAEQARWLLSTVAFHCMAVSDTVYSVAGREPAVAADRMAEEAEMEAELAHGMRALVIGALALLEQGQAGSAR